jgi:hypothetical protein
MTDRTAAPSARLKARIAGFLYLLVIAGGLFAQTAALEPLIVHGDAAATARSIAANEALWRQGIAVHLLFLLAGVPLAFLLYELFKPVQATLARCALGFSVMCMAIEATALLGLFVPLAVAGDAFAGLAEGQRQALGYLGIRLYSMGFGFALLLFSGFCMLIGVLILRSRLILRLVGALMVLAGLCYATNTLALLLAPPLADQLFPWILLPCLVGELSLALWLLVMGVRVDGR